MGKGERTRQIILETAIKVFEDKRFENGSVNEIARRLKVRNSLIYYYFKNKEEIFKELVNLFRDGLYDEVSKASVKGRSPIEKVKNILFAYEKFIKNNRSLYDIFREIEFVEKGFAKDFYDRITNKILEVIEPIGLKQFDAVSLSYAILGSVYFLVLKNLVWDGKENIKNEMKTLEEFLEKGIDARGDFVPHLIGEKKTLPPDKVLTTRGEKTRNRLIKSAEKLFGKKGYERTQISDIAYEANVGLGTFYIYFKSKKEALEEVVKNVNFLLRNNSREYFKDYFDRREIENAGIQAFFYQFKNMGDDYRIVREAEFVDREIGTWYYTRIASAYTKGLDEGIKKGEINPLDSETLAYILMGISHTVGIKWFVLDGQDNIKEKSVFSVLEFIMHGVPGFRKEEM